MDAPPSFTAANSPRLRDAGLKGGYAQVSLLGDALEFRGSDGGGVRLSAEKLDRLRLGFSQGRAGAPYFQALIWPAGDAKPILVLPLGDSANEVAYGATMRGYATALARVHGLDRIERGISGLAAVGGLVLVGFPAALVAVVAAHSALTGDWIGPLAGLVLVAGVTGVYYWVYQRRALPRRITDLAELDRMTPGPNFRL